MQENTNWYWKKPPLQQTIIFTTRTILHPCLDVVTINLSKTSLIIFVTGFRENPIQRHPIIKSDTDYDYILDNIDRHEKLILKGMRVAIVKRDSSDDNNNNEILYVVFQYRIIKYRYVNILLIFIFFSVFSLLLGSFMLILLKMNWCPKCI